MAQEDIRLSGTFLNSSGEALASKTATLYREGTVTPAIATDTTDSDGEWDLTATTLGRYDVQLVSGTETIRILARDKFQVTEIQARNPTTAQPALSAYSTTSEAASLVATFGFRPSTESSGVETPDTPSDGDLGYIDFTLSNDHTDKQEWIAARIAWEGADVSDGSEDGQFNFWAMTAGTLVEELHLSGAALWPEADAGLDLGTSALGFNDLHLGSGGVVNFDGGDVTLTHASDALTLAGGTFTVSGNTVLNGNVTLGDAAADIITINGTVAGANAVIFEGAISAHETTLALTAPTADATIELPAMSAGTYFLPVLDTESAVAISAIPDEINYLDLGATAVGTAIASKAVILDSNKDYTGIRNLTVTGTLSDGNYTFDDSGNVSGLGTVGSGNITSTGTVQGTVITATTGFAPDASDGAYLGTSSLQFTDLFLADGAIINLGDDQDVTLTHVADTGVLLNSTRQLQFGDSGTYIHQSADGVLDLVSDTEIEINATTIDINGAVDISGNATVGGNLTISGTTTTVDTTNTIVKDALIELNTGAGSNSGHIGIVMERGSTGNNAIIAWDEGDDVFTVGTTTATGASTGDLTVAAGGFTAAAIVGTTIDAGTDFTIGSTIITDGVVTDSSGLQLAANLDINGTVDISSTLTLGTVAAAGTDTDKFLVLDGSGNVDYRTGTQVLSDIGGTGATALDDVSTGDAAATLATTVGNITIDAQATDADVVIKVDDNGSAVTAVTFDGSDEGNAIFVNDIQLNSDGALLEFGADQDTTLLHTDGTGLTLNSTNKLTFGDVASFIQQSSDGTLRIDGEAIIDLNASTKVDVSATLNTANLTIAGAQGSDGQVLTSTGSGVAWEDAGGGGTSYDAIVDAAGGGDYTTAQAGDDALDAGDYNMLIKGGAYSTLTVSTNDAKIVVEPGATFSGAIVLSGNNITLVLGAGCAISGLVTLSGTGGSLLCENGVDMVGIIVSGERNLVDGGGWETIVNGGVANSAIDITSGGSYSIVKNISTITTGGGGQNTKGLDTDAVNAVIQNVQVTHSDNEGMNIAGANTLVTGCDIVDCDTNGIRLAAAELRIIGCRVLSAGVNGIVTTSAGDDILITACTVKDSGAYSIQLDADGENCVVVACRVDSAVEDGSGTSTVASNDEEGF